MEDLIENAQVLFDERLPHSSPPLPPAPAGEPVPDISYGSSHTKVTTLPQPSESGEAQVADFTPQLPPRPTSSIHPSARSNPPKSPPHMVVDLLSTPTSITSSTAVSLTVQTPTDEGEKPMQVQVNPNASATEVVERVSNQTQVSIPPSPVSTQNQQQRQEVTDSVPHTPLTASSWTSNSSESRG
jgi:hypothetical protein